MIRHCICTPVTYRDQTVQSLWLQVCYITVGSDQTWTIFENRQPRFLKISSEVCLAAGFSYLRWAATISSYGGSKSCWHFSSGLASWNTQWPDRPYLMNTILFTADLWDQKLTWSRGLATCGCLKESSSAQNEPSRLSMASETCERKTTTMKGHNKDPNRPNEDVEKQKVQRLTCCRYWLIVMWAIIVL